MACSCGCTEPLRPRRSLPAPAPRSSDPVAPLNDGTAPCPKTARPRRRTLAPMSNGRPCPIPVPKTTARRTLERCGAEADEDPAIEELAAGVDSDELCRLLVRSPWGGGQAPATARQSASSGQRHGRGTLPSSLVALLLCTCHRWDRVTTKLIAAIEDSGLLTSVELDELAESTGGGRCWVRTNVG